MAILVQLHCRITSRAFSGGCADLLLDSIERPEQHLHYRHLRFSDVGGAHAHRSAGDQLCRHSRFGEIEFWFCSIKILTIIGLIIVGVIITSGGGPDGEAIGFRYWNQTGGFVQYQGIEGAKGRFLGFFSVLINAAFAFIGTEITAIASAEAADPRRAVPRAIKTVWIRLVVFYLCSAFVIGLLVSPTDLSLSLGTAAAKSPFVIAIKNAGIKVLPSIINAALVTSAWSAGIADLFISSRALYGLAYRGHAPKIFLKTNKTGLPWVCVLLGGAFSLLSFMAAATGSAGTAFGYCKSWSSPVAAAQLIKDFQSPT